MESQHPVTRTEYSIQYLHFYSDAPLVIFSQFITCTYFYVEILFKRNLT
jgi:hypothetical protein